MPVADAMRKTTQQRIAEQNPDIPAAGGAASGGQKGESEFMKKLRQRAEQKRQNEPQPSRENMINSMLADWSSAYKALLTNYNSRFGSLTGTYKDRFIPDTGEWMKEYNAKRKELDEKARHIRGMIGLHGGSLGDDYISRVTSGLDGAAEGTEQMAQGYKAYNDFFGQFKDESEYASWQENYFLHSEEAAGDREAMVRTPEEIQRDIEKAKDKVKRQEADARKQDLQTALSGGYFGAALELLFSSKAARETPGLYKARQELSKLEKELEYSQQLQPERLYGELDFDQTVEQFERAKPETAEHIYLPVHALGIVTADEIPASIAKVKDRMEPLKDALQRVELIEGALESPEGDRQKWIKNVLDSMGYSSKEELEQAITNLELLAKKLEDKQSFALIRNNVDYETKSKPESEKKLDIGTTFLNYDAYLYNFVNDLEGTRDETTAYEPGGERSPLSVVLENVIKDHPYFESYQYMTKDEVADFNYLWNTEGAESAKAYLRYLEPILNQRNGLRMAEEIESTYFDIPRAVKKGGFALVAGLDSWGQNTLQTLSKEKQAPSAIQYANTEILSNLEGLGRYAYLGLNTTGNMLPSILVSKALGTLGAASSVAKGAGLATMGTSVYGDAYGSALELGYSKDKAGSYALMTAASEVALEYLIGGIPGLSKLESGLLNKIGMIDNALLRIAGRLPINTLSEITEEELQLILEPVIRKITLGGDVDLPTVEEMLETAITTAISTPMMGGADVFLEDAAIGSQNEWRIQVGSQIKAGTAGMTLEQMKGLAGAVDPALDDGLAEFAEKTTVDSSAARVGELYERTVKGIQNQAVADAQRQIEEEGFTESEAKQLVNAANKAGTGIALTKSEQALWDRAMENPKVVDAMRVWSNLNNNTGRQNAFAVKDEQQPKDPYEQLRESIQGANSQTVGNEVANQPAVQQARNDGVNLNGGTNYANTQQGDGAAAARTGADTGAGVLYGSGQRNDGTGTGQQAGSLGSRAGQDPQRRSDWADTRREGVRRKDLIQDIRGSAEAVSSKSQGIQTGTDNATMRIVPEEKHTEAMKAEAERIYQETGKQVRYVVGPIEIVGKDGKTRSARGVTTADGIFVRLDHSTPAEKIGRHESFHGMLDAYGEFTGRKTILDGILEELRKNFTPEQIESVLTRYHEALRGVYSGDRSTMDQNIIEEMLADAYAGINAFGAGATKFSEAVQGFMRDNHMSRETTQDNGTEQPTGPPSQNRTFQEEIEAQMRGEPAGHKENTAETGGERYSISPTLESDLQDVLDNTFQSKNNEVYIGETSNFMTGVIGARPLRVTMPAAKAFSAMVTSEQAKLDPRYSEKANYHGLGKDGLQIALERSEDPIAAFVGTENETGKRENSIVLVTDAIYKDGNIVVVETVDIAGWLRGRRINANKVITSYDRQTLPYDIIQAALDGRLLHLDEKRSQHILAGMPGSDYRRAMQGVDFEKNIQDFWANVKWKKEGKGFASSSGNDAGLSSFEMAYREAQKKKQQEEQDGLAVSNNDTKDYTKKVSMDDEARFSLDEDSALADKAIAKNDSLGFVDDTVLEEAKQLRERTADQLRTMKENGVAIPDDIKGNTAISNSSYDITEENTTICPRSLAAEAFVDAVSEYLGRPLTVEEQIYISQDLQGRSLTPECTYCYVATDRKAYRQFLGDYIKQRDAVLEKLKADPDADVSRNGDLYKEFLDGRKDTNPMWGRFKMWVDAYKGGKPMIDGNHLANMSRLMGDINSEFGAELKPQIVDAMKYAQSASWAKKRVSYVAYDGHILNWKQNRIDKLNSHYGLRMYSFSDFHPAFVLENMQMITDAAVRGLKMLGYTKDTDFVEIFAPTGMNINVSTFGFEVGGNVYENNIIGANWEKARALRERYPNVGITFVATNDAMVEWALAQEWIDVVIPFHLVRTGEAVAKAYGFENFTKESSDTKTEGWSKEKDSKYIAPTVHNNDKATYLAALKKNNLKPRFERWIDDPNYMKLVNECRQSASQSRPVQPVFNEEAINTVLAKLKANGYYQPVGGSVERMYEIAAQVAENMGDDLKAVDTSKIGWAQDLPARYSLDDAEADVDEAKEKLVEALRGMTPQQMMGDDVRRLIDQYTTQKPTKPQKPQFEVDRGNLRRSLSSTLGLNEEQRAKLGEVLDEYTGAVKPKKQKKEPVKVDVESKPARAKRNLQDKLLNLFSIPTGQRAAMNSYIGSWADRIVKNGALTEADRKAFFAKMYESGAMTMPGDEYGAAVREYMKGGRIYVADSVVADFGDDWESIRKRAFAAGIYLTRQRVTDGKQNAGIDTWNGELAEQLPWLFDAEATDRRSMLEQIVKLAEEGKEEKISLAEYTAILAEQEFVSEAEVLDNLERQMDFALRTFAEAADIEIQLKERNLRQRLKEQAENKEARDKRKAANELRELQQKTLKQLQWLNRNRHRAPEELRQTWDEVLGDIDLYAVGAANEMNWSNKYNATWKDLAQMYKDAKEYDKNFLPSEELRKIVDRLDATKIGDMDLGALQDLYKAAVGLRTEFYNRNNVISDEMNRLFEEVYADSKREIESAPGGFSGKGMDKLFNMEQLTPMNVLQRMGGWDPNGAFYSMARQLEKGERDMRAYSVAAQRMLDEFLREHEDWVKRADGQGKDGIWYKVEIPELVALELGKKPEFGKTITVWMTPTQKVHMYLESKNQDNLRHMTGGRTFADKDLYSRGKRQEALSQGKTVRLAPETVKEIVSDLTEEEMELANLLERYYNSFATQEINRVSNILYGYDKAMGKNYAPIYTNRNYTKTEFGVFDVTAEGVGNLKGRQYAVNPSYNISALDAFERHVDQTARFVGMAIPARNWTTLMNWRENNNSTGDVITHKWGEEGKTYITDLITTLQAGGEHEERTAGDKLLSNYISAIFGANPSIVLKQLGSIPLASAYLGIGNVPTPAQVAKIDRELIAKYTPDLAWRTMGYTSMETKQLKENPNWTQTNKVFKFALGGGAITAMDGWAASTLWPWAENKVRKEHPELDIGTQEQIDKGDSPFYKKVAEEFEIAVSRSQSVSDEIHQSKRRKSKKLWHRTFTLFKSDSAQTYNAIRQKIGEAQYYARTGAKEETQKAAKVAVGAAVGSLLINALWGEAISFLMALWKNKGKKYRDDEEEELTLWSVISEMGSNMLGTVFGTVIYGEELFEVIGNFLTGEKWYGIDAPGLEQLTDMIETVKTAGGSMRDIIAGGIDVINEGGDLGAYFGKHGNDLLGAVKDVAEAASMYLGGIPVSNLEAYLLGALKWVSPELGAAWDDLFANPEKSDLDGLSGSALASRMQRVLGDRQLDCSKETSEALADLYELGHATAFPGDTPKSVAVDEKTYELTEGQQQTYDTAWSGVVSGAIDDLVASAAFQKADAETQAKMLSNLYSYANGRAKSVVIDAYELSDTDAKTLRTVAAGVGLADYIAWRTSTSGMKNAEKMENLLDWNLDNRAKTAIVGAILGTNMETESGKPSQYAKFKKALDEGLSVDEYLELYADGVDIDGYLKYTAAGLDSDAAADMSRAMYDLQEEAGDDTVPNVQKWRAAVDSQEGVEDQLAALSVVMSESQYRRVRVANNYAIRPDAYVKVQELLPKYDADGNGSYKQIEVTAAINGISGSMGMTTQQKAALWQLVTGSTSAKNNPYSKDVGQKVIDAISKLKAEEEDDDTLSFSDEIMRQLMGRA